jgi:hypothetical protein
MGPAFKKASNGGHKEAPKNTLAGIPKTPSRKRKLSFSSLDSPGQLSPLRKVRLATAVRDDRVVEKTLEEIEIPIAAGVKERKTPPNRKEIAPVKPLRRSKALETSGELCLRSVSGRMNRLIHRSNYGIGLSLFLLMCEK